MKTEAEITRVIISDTGNVRFYAKMPINGEIVEGKSIHYSKTHSKYHVGDTALVEYHYTRNDKVMFEILDSNLVPVSNNLKWKLLLAAIIMSIIYIIVLHLK